MAQSEDYQAIESPVPIAAQLQYFTYRIQRAHRACTKYLSSEWAPSWQDWGREQLLQCFLLAVYEIQQGEFCSWGKWTLARRCVLRHHVLRISCTLENRISALLHTTVLICTAAKASLRNGSVTHTSESATSVWQLFVSDEISKWRFCLQKPFRSLWPPSCINTNPHIKMTHSQLLKTSGCNFPKRYQPPASRNETCKWRQ